MAINDGCKSPVARDLGKAWRGVWGLCHVLEDSAVPSNLSVPKVPEPDWAATSARALKSANWKPPLHCALNGLVIVCLRMCYGVSQYCRAHQMVCPMKTPVRTRPLLSGWLILYRVGGWVGQRPKKSLCT